MNPESASIPLHKAAQRSDFGIFVKEIASRSAGEPVGYAHRDDFYVFGLVTGGSCRVGIDFREYCSPNMRCVRLPAVPPGRSGTNWNGCLR